MGFLSSLRASIEDLVEALVEPGSNILEEEAQLQAASYVCWEVLPTSTLNPNPNPNLKPDRGPNQVLPSLQLLLLQEPLLAAEH